MNNDIRDYYVELNKVHNTLRALVRSLDRLGLVKSKKFILKTTTIY